MHLCYRTTGTAGSKSPAGSAAGSTSTAGDPKGGGASAAVVPAGAQNKQLQNVKGEHPSVSVVNLTFAVSQTVRGAAEASWGRRMLLFFY